ncbi:MAG: hypothetical protein FWF40_00665 [Methanomassiliicoccaceae archaeon]|nr:hypothetical protein [Methanomassiliicoccaceae archaeon]
MGDASTSRASKGKGVLGGLLRRVTGGKNESKEETARTGVSLKDRFSALRGAAPTDPVPHQQKTLDDIHGPDETDVKVIHTSAARSMRFSDRVGMEPCADPFERRISFDENDDDHECKDTHNGACDRENVTVGRYAGNRITFEDDAPCTPEKKDGIGSRYGPADRRAADVPADDVKEDEQTITEAPARMTLAERLKARQADKTKCPDIGTEHRSETSDTAAEVVADVSEKETVNDVAMLVPDVVVIDTELAEDKAATVSEEISADTIEEAPEAAEDVPCAIPIRIIEILNPEPEAAPATEVPEKVAAIPVMPIQIIEILNPEPEAAPATEVPEEVIVAPVMPIQIIEILNPEPEVTPVAEVSEEVAAAPLMPIQIIEIQNPEPKAAPVAEVPEMCIMIPDEIIEEACAERTEEAAECAAVPFAEYLALMPAAAEPILIDDVCSRNMCETAPAAECVIPVVNEAMLEIENDTTLHEEVCDGDADGAELDIMRLLGGVIIDDAIVPAMTVSVAAAAELPAAEEDAVIPFAAFEAIAPEDVHIENETSDDEDEEPDNEICFSFLSEWSTPPNAEVRFVWG